MMWDLSLGFEWVDIKDKIVFVSKDQNRSSIIWISFSLNLFIFKNLSLTFSWTKSTKPVVDKEIPVLKIRGCTKGIKENIDNLLGKVLKKDIHFKEILKPEHFED